jgi:hypothetical protein
LEELICLTNFIIPASNCPNISGRFVNSLGEKREVDCTPSPIQQIQAESSLGVNLSLVYQSSQQLSQYLWEGCEFIGRKEGGGLHAVTKKSRQKVLRELICFHQFINPASNCPNMSGEGCEFIGRKEGGGLHAVINTVNPGRKSVGS